VNERRDEGNTEVLMKGEKLHFFFNYIYLGIQQILSRVSPLFYFLMFLFSCIHYFLFHASFVFNL
jgi:hypothetical protein